MNNNNPRFPKFLVYIFLILSILTLISVFYGRFFVATLYYVSLIIFIVFSMLDKKYGLKLANHKLVYILINVINLISASFLLYFHYKKISLTFSLTLIGLICLILIVLLIDIFAISNKNLLKKQCMNLNLSQILSMICLLVVFYYNSIWFIVATIIFEIICLILKLVIIFNKKDINNFIEDKDNDIIEIIYKNENEGDVE